MREVGLVNGSRWKVYAGGEALHEVHDTAIDAQDQVDRLRRRIEKMLSGPSSSPQQSPGAETVETPENQEKTEKENPTQSHEQKLGNGKRESDPICCPFCGLNTIRYIDDVHVRIHGENEPGADISEWQCHSAECQGRSFWV